jgi:hypothetical protein
MERCRPGHVLAGREGWTCIVKHVFFLQFIMDVILFTVYFGGVFSLQVIMDVYSLYSLFWMCRETRIEGSMTAINGCVFSYSLFWMCRETWIEGFDGDFSCILPTVDGGFTAI